MLYRFSGLLDAFFKNALEYKYYVYTVIDDLITEYKLPSTFLKGTFKRYSTHGTYVSEFNLDSGVRFMG